MSGPRVVALGGGHGLAASLRALRTVTDRLTAVVTVADDGGSSGRLRRAFPHQLPPGDLRMALAALADEGEPAALWGEVFQHRFGAGDVAGHAVGNLVLAGLADVLGDPVAALDAAGRLLGARGRVLPMASVPLGIGAYVAGLDPADPFAIAEVTGQVNVATTAGQVVGVRLVPADPPACPEAVAAVEAADWLVFGPGSWFTSVLPHLLVPDLAKAILATPARRLVVLNISPQPGETAGFSPETHLEVLAVHAPGLTVDVVVANEASTPDRSGLVEAARTLGAEVMFASVGADDGSPRHDPVRLGSACASVFGVRADGPVPSGPDRTAPGDRTSATRGGQPRWR